MRYLIRKTKSNISYNIITVPKNLENEAKEHASSNWAEKSWLFQVNISIEDAQRRLFWCHSGPCGPFAPLMLGGIGEAGWRLLSIAEAQQGKDDCNAAIYQTNFFLNFFVHFSQAEEEKRMQKEKNWRSFLLTTNAWWMRKVCHLAG